MKTYVGLELTRTRIRAVTVNRWTGAPLQCIEIEWDAAFPEAAVRLLEKRLGAAAAVSLSAGLELLQVKHITLPPVSGADKRQMVLLEPDRFFPTGSDALALFTSAATDLIFAAPLATIEKWIAAFEEWGPVDCVEPAPVSLSRAIKRSPTPSGTFAIPAGEGEQGSVEIANGSLVTSRRAIGKLSAAPLQQLPQIDGVAAEFVIAYGAALAAGGAASELMVSPQRAGQIAKRRRRELTRLAGIAALSAGFLLFSLDRSRARVLNRIESETAIVASQAAPALRAQTQLARLSIQESTLKELTRSHADVMKILAILSTRLPQDAVISMLRVDGNDWQVDGTAANAGAIIPALDAEPLLRDARQRAATSRFRDGGRTLESFSIAFRATTAKP
ncbi:MAG: hypothetical protein H0W63_09995 [Gemmatimonadaceae bacterium]|nr:hypothetical protein [Gemmatimonadaceae bacterium]